MALTLLQLVLMLQLCSKPAFPNLRSIVTSSSVKSTIKPISSHVGALGKTGVSVNVRVMVTVVVIVTIMVWPWLRLGGMVIMRMLTITMK